MKKRLGLFLPLLALTVFALVFHPSFRHLLIPHNASSWTLALYSPQLYFLLVSFWILSVRKVPASDVGIQGRPWLKNILIGILYGVTPYIVLIWVNHDVGQVQEIPVTFEKATWGGWTMFSLFILAPFTEEIFFRGIIFHAIRESYSVSISVIASSLLFMASHSPLAIGPLCLGVVNAILTQKTKSIVPGIILHAFSNGLPLFFINHCQNLYPYQDYLFFKF